MVSSSGMCEQKICIGGCVSLRGDDFNWLLVNEYYCHHPLTCLGQFSTNVAVFWLWKYSDSSFEVAWHGKREGWLMSELDYSWSTQVSIICNWMQLHISKKNCGMESSPVGWLICACITLLLSYDCVGLCLLAVSILWLNHMTTIYLKLPFGCFNQ